MLQVNTKVMIRSDRLHRQAHNGHIGTIINKDHGVFEVRLHAKQFYGWIEVCHEEELIDVRAGA